MQILVRALELIKPHLFKNRVIARLTAQAVENRIGFDEGSQEDSALTGSFKITQGFFFLAEVNVKHGVEVITVYILRFVGQTILDITFDAAFSKYFPLPIERCL